jgi:phosphate transport system substrate-binding protein
MIRYFLAFILISVIIFESCFSGKSKYEAIRVRGSDSEVNLVQSLAENFMDNHDKISIGVTGGGSGAGIAALINEKTDLANSSRKITLEEIAIAERRNVNPYEIVFAIDALAVIVNENNPIEELSLDEISAIYSGERLNWDEVQPTSDKITLYGRQSSSGTYLFFRDAVVRKEYATTMIGMSGTAQIVEAVRRDKNGIGYVSSGYLNENVLKGLKVIKVGETKSAVAFSPLDKDAIISGNYPITRPLLQYTNGKPTGTLLEFILFQFSKEGARIISENGFYPVEASKNLVREEATHAL